MLQIEIVPIDDSTSLNSQYQAQRPWRLLAAKTVATRLKSVQREAVRDKFVYNVMQWTKLRNNEFLSPVICRCLWIHNINIDSFSLCSRADFKLAYCKTKIMLYICRRDQWESYKKGVSSNLLEAKSRYKPAERCQQYFQTTLLQSDSQSLKAAVVYVVYLEFLYLQFANDKTPTYEGRLLHHNPWCSEKKRHTNEINVC